MWPELRAQRMDMSQKPALSADDHSNGAASGRGTGSRFVIAATVAARNAHISEYCCPDVTTTHRYRE
jgi:hypothetical protein